MYLLAGDASSPHLLGPFPSRRHRSRGGTRRTRPRRHGFKAVTAVQRQNRSRVGTQSLMQHFILPRSPRQLQGQCAVETRISRLGGRQFESERLCCKLGREGSRVDSTGRLKILPSQGVGTLLDYLNTPYMKPRTRSHAFSGSNEQVANALDRKRDSRMISEQNGARSMRSRPARSRPCPQRPCSPAAGGRTPPHHPGPGRHAGAGRQVG